MKIIEIRDYQFVPITSVAIHIRLFFLITRMFALILAAFEISIHIHTVKKVVVKSFIKGLLVWQSEIVIH